jgi:hypothetical protein
MRDSVMRVAVNGRRSEDVLGYGRRARARSAVRHRDDLQVMPVRVVPAESSATVLVVDLLRLSVERVGPVRQLARHDAPVDLVELVLADEERVVLLRYVLLMVRSARSQASTSGMNGMISNGCLPGLRRRRRKHRVVHPRQISMNHPPITAALRPISANVAPDP